MAIGRRKEAKSDFRELKEHWIRSPGRQKIKTRWVGKGEKPRREIRKRQTQTRTHFHYLEDWTVIQRSKLNKSPVEKRNTNCT